MGAFVDKEKPCTGLRGLANGAVWRRTRRSWDPVEKKP